MAGTGARRRTSEHGGGARPDSSWHVSCGSWGRASRRGRRSATTARDSRTTSSPRSNEAVCSGCGFRADTADSAGIPAPRAYDRRTRRGRPQRRPDAARAQCGRGARELVDLSPARSGRSPARGSANHMLSNAISEVGTRTVEDFRVRFTRDRRGWRIEGAKFYCTGSLGGRFRGCAGRDRRSPTHGRLAAAIPATCSRSSTWDPAAL